MAFLHGKTSAVLYGGYDLSPFFNQVSASQAVETAETTAFGDNAKTYITGLRDGTMSLSGMFDGAVDAVDQVLASYIGSETSTPVTYATVPTIGAVAFSCNAHETSYEVSSPVGDVVSASAEVQATGGIDRSVLLAVKTSVSATGTQAAVDNTAGSSNGAVGYLHLTANAQSGTSIVKVQHSTDNSVWADLITFATASAGSKVTERVAVAGTVNRYVRAQYTLSGSGAVTITVAFSRK